MNVHASYTFRLKKYVDTWLAVLFTYERCVERGSSVAKTAQ